MKKKYEAPKVEVVGAVSEMTLGSMMGSFPDRMGRHMVNPGMMGIS